MDKSILTPSQCVTVAGLRVLEGMPQDTEIIEGVTAADVIRRSLNQEFAENVIDGVKLVESQVDNMQ